MYAARPGIHPSVHVVHVHPSIQPAAQAALKKERPTTFTHTIHTSIQRYSKAHICARMRGEWSSERHTCGDRWSQCVYLPLLIRIQSLARPTNVYTMNTSLVRTDFAYAHRISFSRSAIPSRCPIVRRTDHKRTHLAGLTSRAERAPWCTHPYLLLPPPTSYTHNHTLYRTQCAWRKKKRLRKHFRLDDDVDAQITTTTAQTTQRVCLWRCWLGGLSHNMRRVIDTIFVYIRIASAQQQQPITYTQTALHAHHTRSHTLKHTHRGTHSPRVRTHHTRTHTHTHLGPPCSAWALPLTTHSVARINSDRVFFTTHGLVSPFY